MFVFAHTLSLLSEFYILKIRKIEVFFDPLIVDVMCEWPQPFLMNNAPLGNILWWSLWRVLPHHLPHIESTMVWQLQRTEVHLNQV